MSGTAATARSNNADSTAASGKTRRGHLARVTRLMFAVRLLVVRRMAETKNAQGSDFTMIAVIASVVSGAPMM